MKNSDKIYGIFKNTGQSFYHAENTINELYLECKKLESEKQELLEFIKLSDFYCGQVEQCINDTTGDYRDLDCSDNLEICKMRYNLLNKYVITDRIGI